MQTTEDSYHLGVKALIQNAEGKILLLKVNPAKLHGNQRDYWDIPGGRVQRGATVEETLEREVAEETGLASVQMGRQLAMVLSNVRIPLGALGDVGLILAVYLCGIEPDSVIRLSDEHLEQGWFEPDEAARLLAVKYPKEFTEQIAALNT